MDRLHLVIVLLFGGGWISGSLVDVMVRSGENITLYCDCKATPEEYILWYRNCTHENQPPLVLRLNENLWKPTDNRATLVNSLPRFHFIENRSSGSYDLLIMNVSDSDEGLYYCGTEQKKMRGGSEINLEFVQHYSSVTTRIQINSSDPHSLISTDHTTPQDCSICWKLLFVLCPTSAVLSALIVSLLVHRLCQKTEVYQQRSETSGQTRRPQDEDVFYATVQTRQVPQRPKKKTTNNSDLCTYSAINTARL